MVNDKLIVALDFATADEALALVDKLADKVSFYKVGMELFYSAGVGIIKELKRRNKQVFLDLKLHDIPNTVAQAIKPLIGLGVDIITVHGSGGYTMLCKAAEAATQEAQRLGVVKPKIIAITVLTSISPIEWEELGYKRSIPGQAIAITQMAKKAGIDGVVSSPQEARFIRDEITRLADAGIIADEKFTIITPGVRLPDDEVNDQSRIATPSQALREGASYLVVGRPIRAAADPAKAATEILLEMENA